MLKMWNFKPNNSIFMYRLVTYDRLLLFLLLALVTSVFCNCPFLPRAQYKSSSVKSAE